MRQPGGGRKSAERSLTFIPLSVRMSPDVAGLKVSLQQWSALPVDPKRKQGLFAFGPVSILLSYRIRVRPLHTAD